MSNEPLEVMSNEALIDAAKAIEADNAAREHAKTLQAVKQARLDAIEGLTLADCLQFFDSKATPEQRKIADMVHESDEDFERDYDIVSEGADNGAYVLGWRWVSFSGTDMDKEVEGDDE